jgi:hypothetical protein
MNPAYQIRPGPAVFAKTCHGAYVSASTMQKGHWQPAVQLVRSTPVFRAARTWDLAKLDEQCAMMLDHVIDARSPHHGERRPAR